MTLNCAETITKLKKDPSFRFTDAVLIERKETEFVEGLKEWFPKSPCKDLEDSYIGEFIEFECHDWLAEKKGF